MATRVGNFLGVFAGWLVWRSVGGLPGLLIAVFLVIPLATAIAHAVLVKIGGTGEEVGDYELNRQGRRLEASVCRHKSNLSVIAERAIGLPVAEEIAGGGANDPVLRRPGAGVDAALRVGIISNIRWR